MVKVVASQRGIPAGSQHFEHAAAQPQNGNIKGTAAQIVHRDNAFLPGIQAIGNRRRRRFVQQTQHVQPSQTRSVFGTLTLCIIKISRNGDHHAVQIPFQRSFRTLGKSSEDIGRNPYRVNRTGSGQHHRQAVVAGLKLIRQVRVTRQYVGQ
ncbi:NAD-specific glutamate dehydrogenase [compost metagenome]